MQPLTLFRRISCLLLAGCWLPAGAVGAITACTDSAGTFTYTQFGCPPGSREVAGPSHGTLSVVESPPLSATEQRLLGTLERDLARNRQEREKRMRRAARERSAARGRNQSRCAEARQALAELAAVRRRGYRVADAHRLDARRDHWLAEKKEFC